MRRPEPPAPERGGQLGPRLEPELPEDAGQVTLDRLVGDERSCCPISRLARLWLASSAMRRSLAAQRLEPGEDHPPRSRTSRSELRLGAGRERCGSGPVGDAERLAEELARIFCACCVVEAIARELGERSSAALESRAGCRQCVDRLAERQLSMLPPATRDTCRAQLRRHGHAGYRRPARELELVTVRKAPGAFTTSERELERAQRIATAKSSGRRPGACTNTSPTARTSSSSFCDAPLLEPQPGAGEPEGASR